MSKLPATMLSRLTECETTSWLNAPTPPPPKPASSACSFMTVNHGLCTLASRRHWAPSIYSILNAFPGSNWKDRVKNTEVLQQVGIPISSGYAASGDLDVSSGRITGSSQRTFCVVSLPQATDLACMVSTVLQDACKQNSQHLRCNKRLECGCTWSNLLETAATNRSPKSESFETAHECTRKNWDETSPYKITT